MKKLLVIVFLASLLTGCAGIKVVMDNNDPDRKELKAAAKAWQNENWHARNR